MRLNVLTQTAVPPLCRHAGAPLNGGTYYDYSIFTKTFIKMYTQGGLIPPQL